MKVTWTPNPIQYPSRVSLPALPTNRVYRFRQRWRLEDGRAVPEVIDLDTGERIEVEAHYDGA